MNVIAIDKLIISIVNYINREYDKILKVAFFFLIKIITKSFFFLIFKF